MRYSLTGEVNAPITDVYSAALNPVVVQALSTSHLIFNTDLSVPHLRVGSRIDLDLHAMGTTEHVPLSVCTLTPIEDDSAQRLIEFVDVANRLATVKGSYAFRSLEPRITQICVQICWEIKPFLLRMPGNKVINDALTVGVPQGLHKLQELMLALQVKA